jgi:hypothetical protein
LPNPPSRKRHPLEVVQHCANIARVGLATLHARPAKVLDHPRIDHHYFDIFGVVQGERQLQAVNTGRFETDAGRKMVQRLTGKNAVSASHLARELGIHQ